MRELRMTLSDYTIFIVLVTLTGLGIYRWRPGIKIDHALK